MARTDLQVLICPEKGCVVVQLIGEAHFDFDATDRHIKDISLTKPHLVIVDTKDLTFISSVGMNFLLKLRRVIMQNGGTMRIAALQPQVEHALLNAKLLPMFETYPSADAAKQGETESP